MESSNGPLSVSTVARRPGMFTATTLPVPGGRAIGTLSPTFTRAIAPSQASNWRARALCCVRLRWYSCLILSASARVCSAWRA